MVDYSIVDLFNGSKFYAFDMEFDGKTKIGSIGCVLVDGLNIVNGFEAFNKSVKTKRNSSLNKIHLTSTDNEEDLVKMFANFLNKNGKYPIIVWGQDGEIINKKLIVYQEKDIYCVNICPLITDSIKNLEKEHELLSLEDAKKMYKIEGNVTHDPLYDSYDLAMIFHAFKSKKEAIVNHLPIIERKGEFGNFKGLIKANSLLRSYINLKALAFQILQNSCLNHFVSNQSSGLLIDNKKLEKKDINQFSIKEYDNYIEFYIKNYKLLYIKTKNIEDILKILKNRL